MVGPYPAGDVLFEANVKTKYWRMEHASSWVRALMFGLSRRRDIDIQFFVDSRAVFRFGEGRVHGIEFLFFPKIEPIRLDPWHLYIPGRMRLRRHIQSFRPDVVVGFGTEQGSGMIAVSQSVPSVIFIQGILDEYESFMDVPALTFWLMKRIERHVIQKAGGLVAETAFARDWALGINPRARVRIIPHAVNIEFLQVQSKLDELRILCAGTLDRRKGTQTVLQAFALCKARAKARLGHDWGMVRSGVSIRSFADLGIKANVDFGLALAGSSDRAVQKGMYACSWVPDGYISERNHGSACGRIAGHCYDGRRHPRNGS